MRIFLLVFALIIIQSCKEQKQAVKKKIYNPEFKWTITIPESFDTVSAEQWRNIQNRGAEAIEKTYDMQVENQARTIFIFVSDKLNYFESNWQPFDSTKDGDYLETYKSVNDILYGTFEAQMPGARLDSASFGETISGLTFKTFKITIHLPNKMVMECWMYTRLFGQKEFTVNIMTVDKEKQKLLLDAWKNSKFD